MWTVARGLYKQSVPVHVSLIRMPRDGRIRMRVWTSTLTQENKLQMALLALALRELAVSRNDSSMHVDFNYIAITG